MKTILLLMVFCSDIILARNIDCKTCILNKKIWVLNNKGDTHCVTLEEQKSHQIIGKYNKIRQCSVANMMFNNLQNKLKSKTTETTGYPEQVTPTSVNPEVNPEVGNSPDVFIVPNQPTNTFTKETMQLYYNNTSIMIPILPDYPINSWSDGKDEPPRRFRDVEPRNKTNKDQIILSELPFESYENPVPTTESVFVTSTSAVTKKSKFNQLFTSSLFSSTISTVDYTTFKSTSSSKRPVPTALTQKPSLDDQMYTQTTITNPFSRKTASQNNITKPALSTAVRNESKDVQNLHKSTSVFVPETSQSVDFTRASELYTTYETTLSSKPVPTPTSTVTREQVIEELNSTTASSHVTSTARAYTSYEENFKMLEEQMNITDKSEPSNPFKYLFDLFSELSDSEESKTQNTTEFSTFNSQTGDLLHTDNLLNQGTPIFTKSNITETTVNLVNFINYQESENKTVHTRHLKNSISSSPVSKSNQSLIPLIKGSSSFQYTVYANNDNENSITLDLQLKIPTSNFINNLENSSWSQTSENYMNQENQNDNVTAKGVNKTSKTENKLSLLDISNPNCGAIPSEMSLNKWNKKIRHYHTLLCEVDLYLQQYILYIPECVNLQKYINSSPIVNFTRTCGHMQLKPILFPFTKPEKQQARFVERGNRKMCKLGKLSEEIYNRFPCRYDGAHEYVKRNPTYSNTDYCKYMTGKGKNTNLSYQPVQMVCF